MIIVPSPDPADEGEGIVYIHTHGTRIVVWPKSNPYQVAMAVKYANPAIKTLYLFDDGCVELVAYGPETHPDFPAGLVPWASYHTGIGTALQHFIDKRNSGEYVAY